MRARAKIDSGASGPTCSDRLPLLRIRRQTPVRVGAYDGSVRDVWEYIKPVEMQVLGHSELISFDVVPTPPDIDVYLPNW